jgi:hypothetical protein|tara:strand:- start:1947 stop:2156 length:210 start_codon:yes stop_codon:yes gene_type:complete
MDAVWLAEVLQKQIIEKKSDLQSLIINGTKSFDEYNYLRGRYNSLDDVDQEIRELLKRMGENDDKGSST